MFGGVPSFSRLAAWGESGISKTIIVETGQEEDPIELVEARNMALATQGCSLPALQPWLGTITLVTWKLSTLRDLRKLMLRMYSLSLRMHSLSLRIYLNRGLSVLQQ